MLVARCGRIGRPGRCRYSAGHDQTYYKAFAPRIGLAWSPGSSGKTSIRAGWGLFYNPIEQLVLEQFGAEPPFGGSTFVYETQFNLPFLGQDGATTYLNPFNGVLNPQRGTAQDWAMFEPIVLFGDFQPHMRTQYSAQYNLTIQRELTKDMKLEVGYVGSQGHRLLATHDINYSNPQTCVDILQHAANFPTSVTERKRDPITCDQFDEDAPFTSVLARCCRGFAFAVCAKPYRIPRRYEGLGRTASPWLACVPTRRRNAIR